METVITYGWAMFLIEKVAEEMGFEKIDDLLDYLEENDEEQFIIHHN